MEGLTCTPLLGCRMYLIDAKVQIANPLPMIVWNLKHVSRYLGFNIKGTYSVLTQCGSTTKLKLGILWFDRWFPR